MLKGLIKKKKKIKTMNNKNLSTIESKNKLSKQVQRQNHGSREHFDGYQMAGGCGGKGEEVRGLKSTNR